MGKYKLPEEQVNDIREAIDRIETAEDILKRLRLAGEPNAEAEMRISQLKEKIHRFAKAFEVKL